MMPPYKLTNDGAAAVAPEIKWLKIDEHTPLGTKMLLVSKPSGVAVVSIRGRAEHWTHWCPLPVFDSNEH